MKVKRSEERQQGWGRLRTQTPPFLIFIEQQRATTECSSCWKDQHAKASHGPRMSSSASTESVYVCSLSFLMDAAIHLNFICFYLVYVINTNMLPVKHQCTTVFICRYHLVFKHPGQLGLFCVGLNRSCSGFPFHRSSAFSTWLGCESVRLCALALC